MKAIENCAKSVFAPVVKVDPCYDDFSRREAGVVMQSLIFAAQDGTPASSKFRYLLPQMAYALGLSGRQVENVNNKILQLENDENSRLNGILPVLSWRGECEKERELIRELESSFKEILKRFCKKVHPRKRKGGHDAVFIMQRLGIFPAFVRISAFLNAIDGAITVEKLKLEILKKLAYEEQIFNRNPLIVLSMAKEKAIEMKKSALAGEAQLNNPNQLKITEEKLNSVIAQADEIHADVEALQKLHASSKFDLRLFLNKYLTFDKSTSKDKDSSGLIASDGDYYSMKFIDETCYLPSDKSIFPGTDIEEEEICLIYDAYRMVGFLLEQIQAYESVKTNQRLEPKYKQVHFDIVCVLADKYNVYSELGEDLESSNSKLNS
jgi:hypothetical protein